MSRVPGVGRERGELFVDTRPITWVRDGDPNRGVVLLGHGAGAAYTSDFMEHVAHELASRDLCVVRFHFPYMERCVREGRRFPPDRQPVLLATCRAMLDVARSWIGPAGTRRLIAGGKSMGGRMMSLLVADAPDPALAGMLYLGYPLHPAGKANALRAEHLQRIHIPQLFVSGSRDTLAQLGALERVVHGLGAGARLYVVAGGDHSLAASRREPFRDSGTWLDAAATFIKTAVAPGPPG